MATPTGPEPAPAGAYPIPVPTRKAAPRRGALIALVSVLVLILLLGSTLYIVGRNGTGPLAFLGATATPAATPTPTATIAPTATATPPPPLHFLARTASSMLSFKFEVNGQVTSVTAVDMLVSSGFQCANTSAVGDFDDPSPSSMTWPITNGQFNVTYGVESQGSTLTLTGSFSASHTQASGSWHLIWITQIQFPPRTNQADCSGTWTATQTS